MTLDEIMKALKGIDEIDITVTGRASGRKTSRPVWFVQDGHTLQLLPVKGSDSDWYKNVLKNPTLGLAAAGARWTARGAPVTDAARVRGIAEKFRARYGADEVRKYYSKFDVAVEVPLG